MGLTKQEEKSLKLIQSFEISEDAPRFPISPLIKLEVREFSNVFVKDESHNLTGTHKDRMAWEIVSVYKSILLSKKEGLYTGRLPFFSIISAGSAAYAIQNQLKKFELPSLKVLLDSSTDKELIRRLEEIGCEIYLTSLGKKPLTSEDILELTKNKDGLDITSNKALDPSLRFYDRLSYEVLNENPDYVFVPYGTGQLYENLLNVNRIVISGNNIDPVFKGNPKKLAKCNFIGATTNSVNSKATKLYAPFRPFTVSSNEWVKLYHMKGFCGKDSQILEFNDEYLGKAIKLFSNNSLNAEPSAVAGLALMLQIKDKIPKNSKIIVISTGKSRHN